MRGIGLPLLVCVAWFLTAPAPASAEQVTLTLAQMRAAAAHALDVQDNRTALRLAQALLTRDPEDGFALIVKSRALRNLGQNDKAISAARLAWSQTENPADRFSASLVLAQALASDGKRTRAQFWLRRATQNAPTPRAEAMAARDLQYVRSRNPWKTRLSFGVTPSSNVNGGSKSDTMVIAGLPFELSGAARALSGIEYNYMLGTDYEWSVLPGLELTAGAAVEGKSFQLSSKARKQAPDLKASDLAYQAAQLSFGGTFRGARRDNPLQARLTLGKAYYGGDHLSDFGRLEVHKTLKLNDQSSLRLGWSGEEQWRKDRAMNSSHADSATIGWTRKAENGDILQLSLGLRDTDSDAANIAHTAQIAAVAYQFSNPLFGAYLGVNAVYESRDYDRSLFGARPRRDDKLVLGAQVFLPEMRFYGFAPEIGISLERNRSSEALYDTEDLGLSLGFRSAF